tara:strand:- start:168209 stop:169054 length:846 start_codon:yes stop_codon:yes gene_type:complete
MIGIYISILLLSVCSFSAPNIWINQGNDQNDFQSNVYSEDGISIADYYLNLFEDRSVDQTYLLSKSEFWSKQQTSEKILDNEVKDLQKGYVFSSSNRLLLFEFFKQNATGAKSMCHLYANDDYLKTSEPFFDGNCSLSRVSLKEINSDLLKYDYVLVDGNKIDIRQSPYFFSSGQAHQFIFISNQFATKEITATTQTLKKTPLKLEPWIEGSCDNITKDNTGLSDPIKIYFSKDCVQNAKQPGSATLAFIGRNKYYIISGILISLAALYASSKYDLVVTLP